jgi:hypothetical protein
MKLVFIGAGWFAADLIWREMSLDLTGAYWKTLQSCMLHLEDEAEKILGQ